MEHTHKFEVGKKYKTPSGVTWEPLHGIPEGFLMSRFEKGLKRTTHAFFTHRQLDNLWNRVREILPEVVEYLYWMQADASKQIYSLTSRKKDGSFVLGTILSGPHEIRYQPE